MNRLKMMHRYVLFFLLLISNDLFSQQVSDSSFLPPITHPEYKMGKGPLVFIDEGHHNFHTMNGRYKAFATLLRRDGYQVNAHRGEFTVSSLNGCKILVISNALHESDVSDWIVPNPSAFSKAEITILNEWVRNGGRLFLIADHMPMAGAGAALAASFGYEFTNGFVFEQPNQLPTIFSIEENSLADNIISQGRNSRESVKEIGSFTGQAFKIPENALPVLTFKRDFINMLPDTAWVFNDNTKRMSAKNWSQGAVSNYGKGRVAVFGEAAMFTAQLAGQQQFKMGMNHPKAPKNYQLLLNIIHWLDE